MKNLIMNAYWHPGPEGGPQYFSESGPLTYDDFSLNGYRTCSLTMSGGEPAKVCYEPALEVKGEKSLRWGCLIRAIDAETVLLGADFFDGKGNLVEAAKHPVAAGVTFRFSQQMAWFMIPPNAENAKLSVEFSGKITACTLCAPLACFD